MFEKASRLKLRFDTVRGCLSVEDLWDLPLSSRTGAPNLDDIAVSLHNALKTDTISFVKAEKPNPLIQLSFDTVKHVIEVRLAEKAASDEARAKADQKQKILAIMARKEDAELENSSMDELRRLVDAM